MNVSVQTKEPLIQTTETGSLLYDPSKLYRLRVLSYRGELLLKEWVKGDRVDDAIVKIHSIWASATVKVRPVEPEDLIGIQMGCPS